MAGECEANSAGVKRGRLLRPLADDVQRRQRQRLRHQEGRPAPLPLARLLQFNQSDLTFPGHDRAPASLRALGALGLAVLTELTQLRLQQAVLGVEIQPGVRRPEFDGRTQLAPR